MKEDFCVSFKIYEANGYGMIEICLLSHTNCVFHVLQEVGAKIKVSKWHTSTFHQLHLEYAMVVP